MKSNDESTEPAISVEQQQEFDERLITVLERIAYALELANFRQLPVPPSSGFVSYGYTCNRCGVFVMTGANHVCSGSAGISGGTAPGCTTQGCWLRSGHEGICQRATIT